jgi:hypothetical protein
MTRLTIASERNKVRDLAPDSVTADVPVVTSLRYPPAIHPAT